MNLFLFFCKTTDIQVSSGCDRVASSRLENSWGLGVETGEGEVWGGEDA